MGDKLDVFKVPEIAPVKKKKKNVLEEEIYIEELGKIIERDFFPDLEKLRAQNDYIEAVEKKDLFKLRQIYEKYSNGRPLTSQHNFYSPQTFETPTLHQEILVEPQKNTNMVESNEKEKKLETLDVYLNKNTSEDNESFEEIMAESERKHRLKYSHLYNEEELGLEKSKTMLALPSTTNEKPLNLDTWAYTNKNYIMYIPDGVELTKEEQIELCKKKQKIVHQNTRLKINPFNEDESKEKITQLAKLQAKVLDGRIGVDGKELISTQETPKINGFSLVRSPSPCPGISDESPLMTWGQIEGTPFRLDGSDTPLPKAQGGPYFKINEPQKREKLALSLAEKVSERHRDRKQKAITLARKQFQTPSPSPSRLDRLASMSPAARNLIATKLTKLGFTPKMASSNFSSPAKTPLKSPLIVRTPKIVTPTRQNQNTSPNKDLTDNLLNIKMAKRSKASDFF